jgi:hypothetical protein
MPKLSAATATKRAIKRAPARITKRPAGEPSRFQIWTVSQLLERRRDPRDILLEIASMDTQELARLCDCTMLEALGERRLCATNVLPYVAQKLPIQVDMRHTKAIHLNIVDDVQYQELVTLAETPDANDHMQLQLEQSIAEPTDKPK